MYRAWFSLLNVVCVYSNTWRVSSQPTAPAAQPAQHLSRHLHSSLAVPSAWFVDRTKLLLSGCQLYTFTTLILHWWHGCRMSIVHCLESYDLRWDTNVHIIIVIVIITVITNNFKIFCSSPANLPLQLQCCIFHVMTPSTGSWRWLLIVKLHCGYCSAGLFLQSFSMISKSPQHLSLKTLKTVGAGSLCLHQR